MSAYEVALTYAIADEHLKRLPDVDIHLVLVRDEDQLFENVNKRGREMEKDQFDYLKFHYKNYFDVLDRIFKNEFKRICKVIEERYEKLQNQ
jgi:deoxyadenosine/deoxycytidine kinase